MEPKVYWLLEDGIFEDSTSALKASIEKHGYEWKMVDFPHLLLSENYAKSLFPPESCVIYRGGIAAAMRIQRTCDWIPGPYFSHKNFSFLNYYSYLGRQMLSNNYMVTTFSDLKTRKDWLLKIFGGSTQRVFVKPESSLKAFRGFVLSWCSWESQLKNLNLDPSLPVVVGDVCIPEKEWRLVVADGKVISATQYMAGDATDLSPGAPEDVLEYGGWVAAQAYAPDPVWTLDIGCAKSELYVIEPNSFSCAGLYACPTDPIVETVSNLAKAEWLDIMGA